MKVNLDKIVEALYMTNDEAQGFYNCDTGEIEWLFEFMDRDEHEKTAEKIDCGNCVRLPSQHDIHEYQMMEDFIEELPSKEYQNKLFRAITGKGAFRRFKDTVNILGIEKQWYAFRDEAYKQIALEWCRENNLEE